MCLLFVGTGAIAEASIGGPEASNKTQRWARRQHYRTIPAELRQARPEAGWQRRVSQGGSQARTNDGVQIAPPLFSGACRHAGPDGQAWTADGMEVRDEMRRIER